MATRRKISLLALILVAAALPAAASAQVAAPRLVEDGDEAPVEEEKEPPARPAREAPGPGVPAEPGRPRSGGRAPAGPPPPSAGAPLPAPPPPPATAADLARRIVPVQTSYARLMDLWVERREAEREADPARAEAAGKALLAVKDELAIGNLVAFSAAEVRDSRRALESNLRTEAVARARLAVALAPDLADAHVALARALFAVEPGKIGPVLAALGDGLAAAAREPHTVRAFYGDVASAAFAAVFTAAAAIVLLLALRHLRTFLHDVHHLPLLRGTAFVQAAFLAVVLLVLPVLLGLGPLVSAAVALLAAWLYLGLAERVVASCALLALVALPWVSGAVAHATVWTGSVAERIDEVERGALSDEQVRELSVRFGEASAPAPLHAAIGRHHKRRGNLDEALRYYALAAATDDRAPEIQVNVGNVLFLKGDLDGAKAAYLAAADRAGSDLVVLGAAHYDLSKLYLRTSDMEKSAAAREKAEREAGEFLRRFGSDDDFSANRYLVDVPVPASKVRALAAGDGSPEVISAWVRRRVAGPLARVAWPWSGVLVVACLWLYGLAGARLGPSTSCERCGRPACRRCDGGAGVLCGQCVNVFERRGVVDARDRLRKEEQVRRHEQFERHATRILAIVAGGAGQIWRGAPVRGALLLAAILFAGFLIWFWRGLLPPPQPSPHVLAGKLVVALPFGLALWAHAIRDAFRRTE